MSKKYIYLILVPFLLFNSCGESSIVDQREMDATLSAVESHHPRDWCCLNYTGDYVEPYKICNGQVTEFNMTWSGTGNPDSTHWYITETSIIDYGTTEYYSVSPDILVPGGGDFFLTAVGFHDGSPHEYGNWIESVFCESGGGGDPGDSGCDGATVWDPVAGECVPAGPQPGEN